MIKPGQRIEIFQDPITRKKREGWGTVVKVLKRDFLDGFVRVKVRFDGDFESFDRWVRDPNPTEDHD